MFCVYEETVNRILRMLTAAASPLTPSFPQGFGLSKRSVFFGNAVSAVAEVLMYNDNQTN
jgi:hypothetical protein